MAEQLRCGDFMTSLLALVVDVLSLLSLLGVSSGATLLPSLLPLLISGISISLAGIVIGMVVRGGGNLIP